MKKTIIYILSAAMAIAAAVSCSETPELNKPVFPEGQQGIYLKFNAGELATKATVPGENNENYVGRIDFFIFPMDSLGTDGKLYVKYDSEYSVSGSWVRGGSASAEWTYTEGNDEQWQYKKVMTADEINAIFPNGADSAMVFAVANYCDMENNIIAVPTDDKTWKGMRKLEVGAAFYKDAGTNGKDPSDPDYEYYGLRWPNPKATTDETLFFVMTAEQGIKLDKVNGTVGEVGLARLASKVTVDFKYQEVIDDKGIKWIPDSNGVETRIYLSNAIEKATLGGSIHRDLVPDSWATAPVAEGGNGKRDIFEYAYDYVNKLTGDPYYYTYPIELEEGDDNQPYLKLVLPWIGYQNKGTDDDPQWITYKQKEVYYKIVLPRETITESNKIYQYLVTVNIVGNEQQVEITGEEYVVKPWLKDDPINSNVALGRYISLDIPKDEYDMYSSNVQILFVASGETEISHLKIYKMNYSNTSGAATEVRYIDGGPTDYVNPYNANTTDAATPGVTLPNWVTIQGNKLVINHTLNTDLSDNDVDVTPYIFEVTLHLAGETSTRFDRDVTITQYPPIYVKTDLTSNQNTVWLYNTQYSGTARTVNNDANQSMGTIGNAGSSTAKTKTVVTVTTLASLDSQSYEDQGIGVPVIGDPRKSLAEGRPHLVHTNPNINQEWGANDLDIPTNYMYADIEKSNVIAPKFLIASGYGSCAGTKVNWIHNVERCATYQEDGYPAGRWRLPTEAEMMFVSTLARELGIISDPFYVESHYWSNSGRKYYQNAFSYNNGNYSSRCVYDLWYWGEDQLDNNGNPTTTAPATQWLFKPTK
ncbi:MAG: hypothetical protein IJL91_05020 [Bacteroidales bacterium]|nr:hypothetical protein [Bacteroidales bacterium]